MEIIDNSITTPETTEYLEGIGEKAKETVNLEGIISGAVTIEGLSRELRASGMEDVSDSINSVLASFAESEIKPTARAPLMKSITKDFGVRNKVAELFKQGALFERGLIN